MESENSPTCNNMGQFKSESTVNDVPHIGIDITTADKNPNDSKEARQEIQNAEPVLEEEYDEVVIGHHKIVLSVPKDIIKQVKSFNHQSANKSAGYWAAQIIKKNPQLTHSANSDPVAIWNEIRDNILKKISI